MSSMEELQEIPNTNPESASSEEGEALNNSSEGNIASNNTGEKETNAKVQDKGPVDKNEENSNIADKQEDLDEELDSLESFDIKTAADRNRLYEKGTALYRRGRQDLALKYLLRCITGLDETIGFHFLPQCLHSIADIYYEKGEYEKAIQFIQAEKMYYETALIDTSLLQKKVEEQKHGNEKSGSEGTDPEIARADEYETLAKFCLDKKQPHMALEYQGKATKLRQKVYGEDHPITTKSLDFFTVLYGEVGRFQYSESMDKFKTDKSNEVKDNENSASVPISNDSHSPHSILRSRSTSQDDSSKDRKRKTSRVRFEEPPPDSSVRAVRNEEEQSVARLVLMVVFFALSILLMFLLAFLYCKLNTHSKNCAAWKLELHYYYMRFKYYYFYYTSSSKHTYG